MLAVVLSWAAVSAGASARVFRTADTQTEDYPTVQALNYMDRLIAERTGGRHRIAVFHSRQLGEKETLEQTRAGAIDLNRTNVALIGTMVPAVNALAGVKIVTNFDRQPFEAAMGAIYAKAERDPAISALLERIRNME
jgi:TRAP-type C4-dicarboxylate transport system substrate-binding protein